MNADDLLERVAARANELPGSELTHPFGPDSDVWKVRGKVFLIVSAGDRVAGEHMVTLKAEPDDAVALREQFDEIAPGYHMNKRHWITVRPGGSLDAGQLDDLVTDSYLLVVEKMPARIRPVDPTRFAGGL